MFIAHYREIGAHGTVWSILAANALQQMVLAGVFGPIKQKYQNRNGISEKLLNLQDLYQM